MGLFVLAASCSCDEFNFEDFDCSGQPRLFDENNVSLNFDDFIVQGVAGLNVQKGDSVTMETFNFNTVLVRNDPKNNKFQVNLGGVLGNHDGVSLDLIGWYSEVEWLKVYSSQCEELFQVDENGFSLDYEPGSQLSEGLYGFKIKVVIEHQIFGSEPIVRIGMGTFKIVDCYEPTTDDHCFLNTELSVYEMAESNESIICTQ